MYIALGILIHMFKSRRMYTLCPKAHRQDTESQCLNPVPLKTINTAAFLCLILKGRWASIMEERSELLSGMACPPDTMFGN